MLKSTIGFPEKSFHGCAAGENGEGLGEAWGRRSVFPPFRGSELPVGKTGPLWPDRVPATGGELPRAAASGENQKVESIFWGPWEGLKSKNGEWECFLYLRMGESSLTPPLLFSSCDTGEFVAGPVGALEYARKRKTRKIA